MKEKYIGLPKENVAEITYVEEDTVIEGKHVMLHAEYMVEETLTLRGCYIEVCGGGIMGGGGALIIEDCEICDPTTRFISRRFENITIKDTAIVWNEMFPCLRSIDADCEMTITGCTFENPNLPNIEEGDEDICETAVFSVPCATVSDCTFKGFPAMTLMTALKFSDCRFENCGVIGTTVDDDDSGIFGCELSGVARITSSESKISGCKFYNLGILSVTDCEIRDSEFCDTTVKTHMIETDSDIVGCKFSGITLLGSAVIGTVHGGCVKSCDFIDITRNNGTPLFRGDKKGGFLNLKRVEYDPTDAETCTGI